MLPPLLTKKEADKLINKKEGTASISLDLGMSSTIVLVKGGFVGIQQQKMPLSALQKIKENTCHVLENNALKQIAFFSDETSLYYKLLPTQNWPTITLSSTPMHRYSTILPKKDTELKIKEISPVKGMVLDTCCGLGYTSILSSKNAEKAVTFEKDKNVLRIAEFNPYSKELFSNEKIEIRQKNIFEEITQFEDSFFDRIIHDPPTFKYSPELYSGEFHAELYRVLKKGGILYHYCPCPQKTKNRKFYPRILKQLEEAGFKKVEYHEASSGVRALKF